MQRVTLTRMATDNDRFATRVAQLGARTKLFGLILVLFVRAKFNARTRGAGTLICEPEIKPTRNREDCFRHHILSLLFFLPTTDPKTRNNMILFSCVNSGSVS